VKAPAKDTHRGPVENTPWSGHWSHTVARPKNVMSSVCNLRFCVVGIGRVAGQISLQAL